MAATAKEVTSPIIVRKKVYHNPEAGLHTATITGVTDLGVVESDLGGSHTKVAIKFRIDDEKAPDGSELVVYRRFNTDSMSPKAHLSIFLTTLGFQYDEFDMTELIGLQLNIIIVLNESKGSTYANVDSYSRMRKTTHAVEQF
jgi:hypothetical protein